MWVLWSGAEIQKCSKSGRDNSNSSSSRSPSGLAAFIRQLDSASKKMHSHTHSFSVKANFHFEDERLKSLEQCIKKTHTHTSQTTVNCMCPVISKETN